MKTIFIFILCLVFINCNNKAINFNYSNSEDEEAAFVKGRALTSNRSRESIMKVIIENMDRLRQIYNEEYKGKYPDYMKIVVRFDINYLGIVISSRITETNSNNSKFDSKLLEIINSYKFEAIEKKGTTKVEYPYVFKAE